MKRPTIKHGIIHAYGLQGMVFIHDHEIHVLRVRVSGGSSDLDVVDVPPDANEVFIKGVMKEWVAGNQKAVNEQSRLAQIRQEAEDRAALVHSIGG